MEQEMISTFTTFVSTVGFPIVACVFLYKQNCNLNETHKNEIDTLRTVIENNTISITKLYEKMDALIEVLKGRGKNEDD